MLQNPTDKIADLIKLTRKTTFYSFLKNVKFKKPKKPTLWTFPDFSFF